MTTMNLIHLWIAALISMSWLATYTSVTGFDIDSRIIQQWQRLTEICPNRSLLSCKPPMDRTGWSKAENTVVTDVRFMGLGAWSTFKLLSHDQAGTPKTRGGDSWHIMLRDRRQRMKVPARVFDEGDGTYTVATFLIKPGNFTMSAWLWYSDCHGLQEPQLNQTGDEVLSEWAFLTKADHCYIGERLFVPIYRRMKIDLRNSACLSETCTATAGAGAPAAVTPPGAPRPRGRTWRTETYHYRLNTTIFASPCCRPAAPPPAGPTSRFIFLGDSTVRNSWDIMLYQARQPCKMEWKPRDVQETMKDEDKCIRVESMAQVDPHLNAIMKRCTAGAPWTTVPVGTNTDEISQYFPLSDLYNLSRFDFNHSHSRNHRPAVPLPIPREFTVIYVDGWGCRIPEVVALELQHVRAGDVLVLNMGAHCQRQLPFDRWRKHVDAIAVLLEDVMSKGVPVVWRSTFLIEEDVFRSHPENIDGYVYSAHFNTDARRILFDSYVEHVLVPLGVHIWDVYGLCALGDNKLYDMYHTDAPTAWAMNTDMLDMFVCPTADGKA